MTDIRQSSAYARYIKKIGWQVEKIDGIYIFFKKIPILPAIVKIQRPQKIPNPDKLLVLIRRYRGKSVFIEPDLTTRVRTGNIKSFYDQKNQLAQSPFLPTKTIHVNLIPNTEKIFAHFSEAKRRACRRAENLGVNIIQAREINDFIKLKKESVGFLGFLTTQTLLPLWKVFAPENAYCLMALKNQKSIAGTLILIWQKTAYYWMAASNTFGKKNFAPTLLVWEALREAKKRGCTVFDFEGIYDERYPKLNKKWLGFTKFKTGFGGKEIYFPKPFVIK